MCSDGRLPKNFEIFAERSPRLFEFFSENHQVSLEFSEMICSLFKMSHALCCTRVRIRQLRASDKSFGKFRAFVVPLWWFWLLKRLTEETILSGIILHVCMHGTRVRTQLITCLSGLREHFVPFSLTKPTFPAVGN